MHPHIFKLSLVLLLFLTACAGAKNTPTASPVASSIVIPTAKPTSLPTSTLLPSATVVGRAVLSDTPEMNSCAAQVVVPEGTQVTVLWTYKDFATIQFQDGGSLKQGYLPKANLSVIPAGVPELTS